MKLEIYRLTLSTKFAQVLASMTGELNLECFVDFHLISPKQVR